MNAEMQMLANERKRANFSVDELTNVIDGGKDETKRRREVEQIVRDDPELKSDDTHHMTREECYVNAIRRTVHVYKNILLKGVINPRSKDVMYLRRVVGDFSFGIHTGAFIPSLMSFCSDEQRNKWLPLAINLNIIGTYAQTELAHGSFLRGLQTEAIYDPESEEFVINCPTIRAMKWWPGDLSNSSNHVLVMANLKIKGVSHGMHPFIVQIRDLTTHRPLPGVSVGDIGSKLGLGVFENGFLYLQNVRIPRENLLCKNAEVLRDGTYRKKASDRLMYGSMVNLRVLLQRTEAIIPLAQVLTIAVRYSTVRCQGLIDPGMPEVAVMEYTTQQYKLLPQVAALYSNLFAVDALEKKYRKFLEKMETGDISELPELHALSAGMKAFVTEQCIHSAEIARRACGGHGYSSISGLPDKISAMMASCTYEGENTVMFLQCARFLMKCVEQPDVTGSGFPAYLNDPDYICPSYSSDNFSPEVLMKCFQQRSKKVAREAAGVIAKNMKAGQARHFAWNNAGVFLMRAAKAHILQSIVTESMERVRHLACTLNVKTVLTHVISLHALHQLNNDVGDFLRLGILTPVQCGFAQQAEMDLLAKIRPNAVALVDAFDFSDDVLHSCLGVYDGNVYESLYECAKKAPFNKTEVHEASYQYIQPYLHEGRDKLEREKSKL